MVAVALFLVLLPALFLRQVPSLLLLMIVAMVITQVLVNTNVYLGLVFLLVVIVAQGFLQLRIQKGVEREREKKNVNHVFVQKKILLVVLMELIILRLAMCQMQAVEVFVVNYKRGTG